MAYNAANLSRVSGGSGWSWWYYSSTDAIADINTVGYFNDAAGMLKVNDYMVIASSTGGTPVISHAYVNANSGTVVDIIDGVAITATDGD